METNGIPSILAVESTFERGSREETETNGIHSRWRHPFAREKEEAHIEKKRKLMIRDGDMTESSTYDPQTSMFAAPLFTLEHSLLFDEPILRQAYSQSRLACSQDIMGNLFCSASGDSGEESSKQHVEQVKKKKKKSKKVRERERELKKELVDLETSVEDEKKKEPRIGTQYQCDMSVLENNDGNRDEFIGELVWDPSKVSLESVDKFLQEVQLPKPLKNQFEFDPFSEYIPSTSIIALDKILELLMKFNCNFEKTKRYLMDRKLLFTDRGFAVRRPWKSGEIKIFEKALKFLFEQEGDFDLVNVNNALPLRPMNQICEFYFAWKHSKRFQAWRDESHCPEREKRRDRGNLRPTVQVNYNDHTSVVLRNLDRNVYKVPRIPRADTEVIQTSNEGDDIVYSVVINAQTYDADAERNSCLDCITKKNVRTDKFFLDYS